MKLAVVIGAQKAGTTSMYLYLRNHPDICVSSQKECNFFSDEANYRKGIQWYEGQFDRPSLVCADVSPDYTKGDSNAVAARLHGYAPEARLIYILRDPVERLVSHYLHKMRKGRVARPLRDLIYEAGIEGTDLFMPGYYYRHLQAYLGRYPREQMLVMLSEDLRGRRVQMMNMVHEHIGVMPQSEPSPYNYEAHVSKDAFSLSTWTRVKHLFMGGAVGGSISDRRAYSLSALDVRDREHVRDIYRTDIDALITSGINCRRWLEQP